eukprot:3209665-Amphidinium_carterae.1
MQLVEAENARLRADGLGALPQLIQVLQTQTQHRLPSLVDTNRQAGHLLKQRNKVERVEREV